LAGGLDVALGVPAQLAAFGLIFILFGIMFGAIYRYRKAFSWHTGLWGENASGRHYDLIFLLINLVMSFTDGGA
jgi:putative oxidoreductase